MLKKTLFGYVAIWFVLAGFSIARYAKILAGQCHFFTNGWLMCTPQLQLSGLEKSGITFFIVAFFTCFLLATWLLWKNNDQTIGVSKQLKWLLLSLGILAVFVAPLGTTDMPFDFSAGKAVNQGLNPYADQWVHQVDFTDRGTSYIPANYFPYGPIIAETFRWFYRLSGDKVVIFMLVWKFFMLLTLAGCGFLIMKLGSLFSNGKNTTTWYILWFAQPILLWEWVVNGHFDGLWLLFVLLAIYAAHTKRWWLMVPALTIGIWIKFVPVLLVPFFALWWWQDVDKQTWKKNLLQMGFGLAIAGRKRITAFRRLDKSFIGSF